ncbi:MAG TPA: hypothetical protein VEX11_17775, partial [Acetobacteraceae bacterium]|nr:hypothetical protein [Acetobacteraceae bacterium]
HAIMGLPWNVDGVSDGDHYNFIDFNGGLPKTTNIWLNGGEALVFYAIGVEEDGGLFDPHDRIPGILNRIDPFEFEGGFTIRQRNSEFDYTLHFGLDVWG